MATGSDADCGTTVDLAALAGASSGPGATWTRQTEDLNVNLLVFSGGEGVAEHVNAEIDVLLVGVVGEGVVEVDGRPHALRAGQALVVPKGVRRATRAGEDRFAYLTCHRRRAGLRPDHATRPASYSAGGEGRR